MVGGSRAWGIVRRDGRSARHEAAVRSSHLRSESITPLGESMQLFTISACRLIPMFPSQQTRLMADTSRLGIRARWTVWSRRRGNVTLFTLITLRSRKSSCRQARSCYKGPKYVPRCPSYPWRRLPLSSMAEQAPCTVHLPRDGRVEFL